MTGPPAWRRYLRFWRPDVVRDVDDELRFHAEMRVQEYVAAGMTKAEARRAVAVRLGDVNTARADCIAIGQEREDEQRRASMADDFRMDVRFALRSLARTPGWTAVALLTIALGVGATTTVYRVADALLVRAIPYPDADRVFIVRRLFNVETMPRWLGAPTPASAVREWRDHARTIEAIAPFEIRPALLGSGEDSTTVNGARVDAGFLPFAGVEPVIGRNFTAEETQPGGPSVLLLSERLWKERYDGSPDVLGSVVQVNGRPWTIVGVVPASLSIPEFRLEPVDVFGPLVLTSDTWIRGVIARLEPGTSPEAAAAELNMLFERARFAEGDPPGVRNLAPKLYLTRPQDFLEVRKAIVMLSGAVALLLLVACANIAHLLLVRGAARQRELAVRHSLGAGRWRIVRQLMTETLLLAGIGGVLAGFVGWVGLRLLLLARPSDQFSVFGGNAPNYLALSHVTTAGILPVAASLALGTGLLVGLVGAIRVAHAGIAAALRSGKGVAPGSRRLRGALVVGEIGLSATLLVGALLLIHDVFKLRHKDLGFDADVVYEATFELPRKLEPAAGAAFVAATKERLSAVPGIAAATWGRANAASGRRLGGPEAREHPRPGDAGRSTTLGDVAPDYLAMMGVPLLAGRHFDSQSSGRNEVIVNATLARQLWPNESALGRQVRSSAVPPLRSGEWGTVIGVVPDVIWDVLEKPIGPMIYHPNDGREGMPGNTWTFVVRLTEAASVNAVRRALESMVPTGTRISFENVRETLSRPLVHPRFTMRILMVFAVLGVVLAAIGLFGVVSYSVVQRTQEIGVRMALGATQRSIAALVIGDGARLTLLGIGVGLLGAVAATRIVQALLYDVSRLDPLAFGAGAVLLLAVSMAACVLPMLRATRIDPATAVRVD